MQREGDVFCMLRAGSDLPRTAKRLPPEVRRIHYQGDEETHFSVFDVDCVVYPDPDHGKEQLRRLQQTMDELRKAAIRS